jgi:hypothetical protein
VPARRADQPRGVGTFSWPPAGTSTWPLTAVMPHPPDELMGITCSAEHDEDATPESRWPRQLGAASSRRYQEAVTVMALTLVPRLAAVRRARSLQQRPLSWAGCERKAPVKAVCDNAVFTPRCKRSPAQVIDPRPGSGSWLQGCARASPAGPVIRSTARGTSRGTAERVSACTWMRVGRSGGARIRLSAKGILSLRVPRGWSAEGSSSPPPDTTRARISPAPRKYDQQHHSGSPAPDRRESTGSFR